MRRVPVADVQRASLSMRYSIEIAPKNGHTIVLEDEASRSLEVARWSSETSEWIGEFGRAIAITPTHWYPCYSFFELRDAGAEDTLAEVVSAPGPGAAERTQIATPNERQELTLQWMIAMAIIGVI